MITGFWKITWIVFATIALGGLTFSLSLFYAHAEPGDLLAALGVSYQEGKDPFQGALLSGSMTLQSGYLYQDALPLRFSSWSWQASADWRSGEEKKDGPAALKATFAMVGGSVGMQGPVIDTSHFSSISLAVRPDKAAGDVYLDLYDANGNSLGRQSLGWYAASSTDATQATPSLVADEWQTIVIPLANFATSAGKPPSSITGFSVSGKNPGTAYIDDVRLTTQSLSHAIWVMPPEVYGQVFNPFATSSPVSLPYTFSPSASSMQKWYSYFGDFGGGASGQIEAGPSPAARTTGSMTVFRGGHDWVDYHTEAVVNWGQVSVFSLLVRFADDGDFASCAFSRYGETVQLYTVSKGKSVLVSQSPPLAVKDYEPWKDVHVGAGVVGSRVSCFIDGQVQLSGGLPDLPSSGSVGLETWDPNPDAAPDTLTSLEVVPIINTINN